ncbi:hypothetical protein OG394_25260 [Kribbella sp. NBC_01245]|uniref:hypothetical protein n=1 Tax=Kribbella sp. NBC_01245 TaxID=2903578 RepID=UPI002E284FE2|nr:hypothetical protein [Kribbella sp. NBC_01245]
MNSVETALRPILRDLRSTAGITVHLSDGPTDDDPRYESMWLLSTGDTRTGLLAPLDMEEPERLVHIADQVQEFVHEELGRLGLPATWPECPEHPASHPLTPTLTENGPCWLCPKSGAAISPIGEL